MVVEGAALSVAGWVVCWEHDMVVSRVSVLVDLKVLRLEPMLDLLKVQM